MRFYPRNALSRADALGGPGHIGNHGPTPQAASGASTVALDRDIRYKPAVVASAVLKEYGGTK